VGTGCRPCPHPREQRFSPQRVDERRPVRPPGPWSPAQSAATRDGPALALGGQTGANPQPSQTAAAPEESTPVRVSNLLSRSSFDEREASLSMPPSPGPDAPSDESAWSPVPVSPPARFSGPLAE